MSGNVASLEPRRRDDEQQVREELAALYRLFVRYGWTDLIYTHLAAKVPGEPEHYLINPYGLMFEEITASNLLKVSYDGRVIEGDYPVNDAGHLIHTAVLKARPEVNFTLHSHTRAGMAVSAMSCGLLPLTQHASLVLGTLCSHDYQVVTNEAEECALLARSLGQNYAMIMRNHGLLTCGRTAAEAFWYHYYLEMSCKVQVDVLQSGQEPVIPAPEAIEALKAHGLPGEEPKGARDWPSLLRKLERTDPDYRS